MSLKKIITRDRLNDLIERGARYFGRSILYCPSLERKYDITLGEEKLRRLEDGRKGKYLLKLDDSLLTIIKKILSIQKLVDSIDNAERLVIYGENEHIRYLLKFIDFSGKNIVGIVGDRKEEIYGINVGIFSLTTLSKANKVIVASYKHQAAMYQRLIEYNIQPAMILTLYGEDAACEFYSSEFTYSSEEYNADKLFEDIEKMMSIYEMNENRLISYTLFPKTIQRYTPPASIDTYREFGIVIQGPIVYENNFTLNSIVSYKSAFPGCKIVLSTWSKELDNELFNEFKTLDIDIITSDEPDIIPVPSLTFINFQLKSTYAGLQRMKEIGVDYVLKTRTDARITSPDLLDVLIQYRRRWTTTSDKQKECIVCMPPYIPNHDYFTISDLFMCGSIEDMLQYWEYPINIKYKQNPEYELSARYFTHLNINYKSYSDFINGIAKYFIVLDIDQYMMWNKYDHSSFATRYNLPLDTFLSHQEWMRLHDELR